ncbi:MAG: hypothetical protein Q9164_007262 [Protoblastenia rupestris]
MSEPRRISTRYRGEPPPKKRALTPTPSPAPPAPAKDAPAAAEPLEQGLPNKLREGQPLPTLPEPQDASSSSKLFQSISESGVLAASIERSRQKWMTDGVFERYWAKPSKKKGTGEAPQPAKESMSRLGSCSMIIEPHAFEVTLYTVKDLPMSYQYPSFPPQPLSYHQYNPYPQSTPYVPPYGAPFTGTAAADQGLNQRKQGQPSLPPFREGFGQLDTQILPPIYHPPTPTPAPASESRRQSKSSTSSHESKLKDGGSNDPVIQMLATRAASDYRLKGLMKIVAAGNASPEQLKEFQSHIDELNTLLKSPRSPNASKIPPPGGEAVLAPTQEKGIDTSQHTQSQIATTAIDPPPSTGPSIKTEAIPPYFPPVPPPTRVQPPTNKPDVHSIVFDFGGTGDRFTFPRFSMLEYLPGGMQVIVSFLAIRRGSMVLSGKYKDSKSYYQTVTMRLISHHPRTLESLARIVAPPDEVRKYMDSIFDKMNSADNVYLATRLPRRKESDEAESNETPPKAEVNIPQSVYPPPTSVVPLPA